MGLVGLMVLDGDRLDDVEQRIDGDDLAVEQNEIGGRDLRVGGRGPDEREQPCEEFVHPRDRGQRLVLSFR